MTQNRKPTPKSQYEISQEGINPYDKERGNSNKNSNKKSRAEQQSFKGDTTKSFSIGIQDIDEAIIFYFKNIIKPFVITNSKRIEVPVEFGDPEKWKQIQKDGYFRDSNGKIMAPVIVIKNNGFSKNRSIGNKLDANYPHLYSQFIKNYSKRNFYDNFNVLNDIKPEKEQYAIVIPDYIDITYSCIIYTYYISQMNKIIEAIEYSSDSYWGDPERFKFNTRIDSFNNTIEVGDGKDRAIKSSFEIKLKGYIIPDVIQKDVNSLKKIPTINKIVFGLESVTSSSFNSL